MGLGPLPGAHSGYLPMAPCGGRVRAGQSAAPRDAASPRLVPPFASLRHPRRDDRGSAQLFPCGSCGMQEGRAVPQVEVSAGSSRPALPLGARSGSPVAVPSEVVLDACGRHPHEVAEVRESCSLHAVDRSGQCGGAA